MCRILSVSQLRNPPLKELSVGDSERSVRRFLSSRFVDFSIRSVSFPTDLITIFVPQHPEIGEFNVIPERHATDFDAPKLRKGQWGLMMHGYLQTIIGLNEENAPILWDGVEIEESDL